MRRVVLCLLFVVFGLASSSSAQGVIEGTARDTSRAPLPGVEVEARHVPSGATRTATTDAGGRYRLGGLAAGSYTITFRVAGFQRVEQRVELPGSQTVVLNATMAVVPITETVDEITLFDPLPAVNVQSATRTHQTLSENTFLTIPNRRNYNSLIVVVPGVTTARNDVVVDPLTTAFPFHGGRTNEGRLLLDGLSVGSAPLGGSPAEYLADITNAHEVTFTTHALDFTGGLGAAETAGLVMSIVPKHGADVLSGSVSFAGNSAGMQGDNVSEDLRALGFETQPAVENAWELGAAVGGRIVRARAWYFASGRRQSLTRAIPGLFYNQNAGNASSLQYVRDLTRRAYSDRTWDNVSGRLTWMVSRRHTFSLFADEQAICRSCSGATSASGFPDSLVSPEAQGVGDYPAQRVQQVSWTFPATNRWLLDARFGRSAYGWGNGERDDNDRSLVRVIGTPPFGGQAITYRSQDWADNRTALNTWHAVASFVTGSHSLKAGYQGLFATDDRTSHSNDQSLTYRLSNGFANQLTQVIAPFSTRSRVAQSSAYLQDAWTAGRLTLHGALRFDRVWSWFPEQRIGPARFLPAGLVFPAMKGVDAYSDVTPRAGAAYDLTGDGKTALKILAGKYLEGAGTTGIYADINPATRVVRSASRSWFDNNNNLVPDCVLDSVVANGECGSLGASLGQVGALTIDSSLLNGSGVRPSDWNLAATMEREFMSHAAVAVGYVRRWFDGFTVLDNAAVGPADFQTVTVTAPQNPNLPASGRPIGPLYIQSGASLLRFQPLLTSTDDYGDQSLRTDSLDVVINGWTYFGLRFQGGSSTTWIQSDSCEIRAALPESAPLNPYCRVSSGALTQFRGLAAYRVPALGLHVGAVYQNKPGPPIVANGTAFVTSGGFGFVTVNLVEPGTLYGERISQLDLRAVKEIRLGRGRILAGIDLYNAFNSADPLTYSPTYSSFALPTVTFPTSIMSPRVLRVTADLRF
jgi:hypothetical protein